MRSQMFRVVTLVLTGALILASTPLSAETSEESYRRGLLFGQQGNYAQALSNFSRAIAIDPRNARALNNRGVVYYKLGKMTEALFDFIGAIEIDPRYAEAYQNRGLVYGKQGNLPQAVDDFTKAIQFKPADAKLYMNRAVAYYGEKDYDKAWADVLKAVKLGLSPRPDFLDSLRQASGQNKDTAGPKKKPQKP